MEYWNIGVDASLHYSIIPALHYPAYPASYARKKPFMIASRQSLATGGTVP